MLARRRHRGQCTPSIDGGIVDQQLAKRRRSAGDVNLPVDRRSRGRAARRREIVETCPHIGGRIVSIDITHLCERGGAISADDVDRPIERRRGRVMHGRRHRRDESPLIRLRVVLLDG